MNWEHHHWTRRCKIWFINIRCIRGETTVSEIHWFCPHSASHTHSFISYTVCAIPRNGYQFCSGMAAVVQCVSLISINRLALLKQSNVGEGDPPTKIREQQQESWLLHSAHTPIIEQLTFGVRNATTPKNWANDAIAIAVINHTPIAIANTRNGRRRERTLIMQKLQKVVLALSKVGWDEGVVIGVKKMRYLKLMGAGGRMARHSKMLQKP